MRGLEPGQAAQRGRDADRPAAIAARSQGHHARRRRGRRTPRGAARRASRIPGVAGRSLRQAGGVALVAELGRGRLAQHDTARGPQARHQRRVGGRRRILDVQQRTEPGGEAGRVLQVLDPDRDAGQRPDGLARRDSPVDRRRLGQRPLGVHHHPGVELRIQLLDAPEGVGHELDRRVCTAGHPVGQVGQSDTSQVHRRDTSGVGHARLRPGRAAAHDEVRHRLSCWATSATVKVPEGQGRG